MKKIFGGDCKSKNNLNNTNLWKSSIKYHFKLIINPNVPLKTFDEYIEKSMNLLKNLIEKFLNKIEKYNFQFKNKQETLF